MAKGLGVFLSIFVVLLLANRLSNKRKKKKKKKLDKTEIRILERVPSSNSEKIKKIGKNQNFASLYPFFFFFF